MLYAQKLAMENNLPLHVVDCLSVSPEKHPEATLRVYDFVTKALAEIEEECRELNIGFHVLTGPSPPENLLKFIEKHKVLCFALFTETRSFALFERLRCFLARTGFFF